MPPPLLLVFFLSGCAALLFETLWFRQAGLLLGSSVWTSSAVLGSLMAGLALGNGLAARHGRRLARPVRAFAALELVIGLAGLSLVLIFPLLTARLASGLGALTDSPTLLNGARFAIAFVLLLVPATAMGATLPVLVSALTRQDAHFGRVLGALYGANTLGAVAGALLGEAWLIRALGMRGTGFVAAALDGIAATVALLGYRHWRGSTPLVEPVAGRPQSPAAWALQVAAFLAGGTLLALEVVWFRFLLLWVNGNSLAFAVMLGTVLFGIGAGGLAGAALLRLSPESPRWIPAVAALACLATTLGYALFPKVIGSTTQFESSPANIASLALPLMLATALLSGVLFTLLGASLNTYVPGHADAAGRIALANTLGALCGAPAGALVLLPHVGMEISLFSLSGVYLLIAAVTSLAQPRTSQGRGTRLALGAGLALAALTLALFPFGLMQHQMIKLAASRWLQPAGISTSHLVAVREGLNETILYVETRVWGEPIFHRLVTNAFSMSGTNLASARYMRLFVWLPMALRPEAQDALLISFGVGTTAKALTDTRSLRSIDVVDISSEVLELGRTPYALTGGYPLDDPRVHVQVEDGRFFLLSTQKHYDLITAEPPPPKCAGIVNLYSREYFALLREHLNSGGLATYWLPVYQLSLADTRGVMRAFCDVFADCTLWSGTGPEWILMGSRDGVPRATEEAFERQWRDPVVAPRMREVGLETPEQMGRTFIADGAELRAWIGDTPALVDDHPYRLSPDWQTAPVPEYLALAATADAKSRFGRSAFVRASWPDALRQRTFEGFETEDANLRVLWAPYGWQARDLDLLNAVLTSTAARAPVLWLLSSDARVEQALDSAERRTPADPSVRRYRAISAFADRDYGRAQRLLESKESDSPAARESALQFRVLALVLAGQRDQAVKLLSARAAWPAVSDRGAWLWLIERFDLPDPLGLAARSAAPEP